MACSLATSPSTVAWSGRAPTVPSQMLVEVATTESFRDARALPPIAALPESDFTAKMLIENLPGGQDIFYRVRFRDLSHTAVESEPVTGRFRTAPADRRDVSFVWGGDVAGQGWGINPDDGGMFTFSAMRKHRPDFFLHSGDTIYADGPIQSEVKLADGKIWKNVTIPEKAKVAETLDEYRAAHKYNFTGRQRSRLQRRSADLRAVGRP
ncbi:phosphodiesterase/alkaline phosphatase D-like protein [Bradyrhizobium sp. LM6.10]